MHHHIRTTRTALILLAGGALALGPAIAPAQAVSTQVGATFASNGQDCSSPAPGQTVLQTASPGGSYAVPAAGVITSWSTVPRGNEANTQIAFKVARGSGSTYSIVGSGAPTAVTGTALKQDVRIPVLAGDVLGIYYQGAGNCARLADNTYVGLGYGGNVPVGPAGAPAQPASPGIQLNVAAVVESDADGDGFGDTTQDLCPTKATTQKECVAPVTSVVAKAGKAKRKANGKFKKAKVTVAFAVNEASTSTCSVDGGPAVACASPLVFKAKKGTHTVTVTSTDAAGNVGTPVTTAVKVKKAKAKKK